MERASALKISNKMTKFRYMSAYKSWKSETIIQFRTNAKYTKLTESNICKTHTYSSDYTARSEIQRVYGIIFKKKKV